MFKGAALSGFAQFVQRNRLRKREGAGPRAPQHRHMPCRSQRPRDVAGEGADVGALGDGGGEGDGRKKNKTLIPTFSREREKERAGAVPTSFTLSRLRERAG